MDDIFHGVVNSGMDGNEWRLVDDPKIEGRVDDSILWF